MFGIGGSEFIFIIIMILMLFGSDKVPDIARTLGKIMRQLKHATNDIKSEIQKSAESNGLDSDALSGGISKEINKIKEDFRAITDVKSVDATESITAEIDKVKEDIENITGPIKRQM